MGYIFRKKGGKIQESVNQKANTKNIPSATIIDLIYGLFLFVFGNLNPITMSTTWVFIGIIAGRELAITYLLNKDNIKTYLYYYRQNFGQGQCRTCSDCGHCLYDSVI